MKGKVVPMKNEPLKVLVPLIKGGYISGIANVLVNRLPEIVMDIPPLHACGNELIDQSPSYSWEGAIQCIKSIGDFTQ
jgi:hypothetical protein